MKIAMFGATGYIGGNVLKSALDKGHEIQALVRDESKLGEIKDKISVVSGSLSDSEAVKTTMAGCEAVLWAVGLTKKKGDVPELYVEALKSVLEQMKQNKISRIIVLSGAAMQMHNEILPPNRKIMRFITKLFVKQIVITNQLIMELLHENFDLDWTIARPGHIIKGAATGKFMVDEKGAKGTKIVMGDLANFFVDQLESQDFIHMAPIMVSVK